MKIDPYFRRRLARVILVCGSHAVDYIWFR